MAFVDLLRKTLAGREVCTVNKLAIHCAYFLEKNIKPPVTGRSQEKVKRNTNVTEKITSQSLLPAIIKMNSNQIQTCFLTPIVQSDGSKRKMEKKCNINEHHP